MVQTGKLFLIGLTIAWWRMAIALNDLAVGDTKKKATDNSHSTDYI